MQKERELSEIKDQVEVVEIIYDSLPMPVFAKVKYNGALYYVLLDSTQMSQEAIAGYAKYCGIESYPVIKVIYSKESVVMTNAKNAIDCLVSQGYKNFVLPIISSDGKSGSGHTMYIIGLIHNGQYSITLIDQTEKIFPDKKAVNGTILANIVNIIEDGGVKVKKVDTINGAFPPEENVASCTEIGGILLEAMKIQANSYENLSFLINEARQTLISIEEIVRIRFLGVKHSLEKDFTLYDLTINAIEIAGMEIINGKIQLNEEIQVSPAEFILGSNLNALSFRDIDINTKTILKSVSIVPECQFTILKKDLQLHYERQEQEENFINMIKNTAAKAVSYFNPFSYLK